MAADRVRITTTLRQMIVFQLRALDAEITVKKRFSFPDAKCKEARGNYILNRVLMGLVCPNQ
jgi:hypothetical protein